MNVQDVRWPGIFLVLLAATLVWSGIHPHDYFTWILEVLPIFIGIPLIIAFFRRFRFTSLVYLLIFLHAIILAIGGHYTYAEVPLFTTLKNILHLSRNHYDRLGHFMQGFEPAMLTREMLLRKSPLRRGPWLLVLTISVCLALSAGYELFEWSVAVTTGSAADAFLGSQGDVWDTQWDMFMALIGAVTAILTMSRVHDHQLEQMTTASNAHSQRP